ncbi:hypothetical protein [Methylobacterium sp. J-077]|uniref:hypothetical protein n=1 Tax=Methylobacterium sp. J-077 TaxID=2836656 RepID=UPI001FBA6AFE|nr:hypothetical protein [Methylobacterium sp. J-077]MCJ2122618.1 hypothetical protein [Methylobacterium sp. J-077]
MKSLALFLVLTAWAGDAAAMAQTPRPMPGGHGLTDAVFIRPLYGVYRHCGGACLKSGSLNWFCFAKQDCYLSCATAPPAMKCATP